MKKVMMSVAVLAALSSSVFAMGGMGCSKGDQMGVQQGCQMGAKGMQGGMHGCHGGMEMRMLGQLNLSDEQRHKLAILNSEMKLEMTKLHDPKMKNSMQNTLSAESFDKKAFIKMHNDMHEKMIALKANHMEKVYNLLTKEQRAELKKLVEQKPMMGKKS